MRPTLRALGLKSLKDIPDHIPTVRWSWVLTVIGRDSLTKEEIHAKLRDVWMHAAFSERMDAGYTPNIPTTLPSFRKKGKEKAVTEAHDEGPSEPERSCVFFISFLLCSHLNLLRDNASTSVIQPLRTDKSEVAIRPLPSPPISPSPPRQFGQASTSKVISDSNDDHADPLAQFYGKARAQQKLKEDGVSVNYCFQITLLNVFTMKWSSVGELDDIDDSDEGETDNDVEDDLPHPITKRVRSKVYFSRGGY